MNPANAVTLIAGGGSGLGEATARMLVGRGGRVAILDLPSSHGAAIAEELGDRAVFLPTDVTDPEQVRASVGAAAEAHGRIDACVNCAGVVVMQRTIDEQGQPASLDDFRRAVDINLVGTFDVARMSAREMAKNEPDADGHRGLIVNTSSVAGLEGQAGSIGYAASKAAVNGMTLPMARDLAPWGIRVVAIAPGPMETPMLGESAKVSSVLENPLFPKRVGRPDEFAHLVGCVMENELINATVLRLDAGTRLKRL